MRKLILLLIIFITIAIFFMENAAYSQCNPVVKFPWIEGFENNGTNIPPCWSHGITGDPDWEWTVTPNSIGTPSIAQEGSYKARSYYSSNTFVFLNRSMLITPVFDLSALNKPVLVYWHTQKEKGSLRVYYRNTPSEEWRQYLQTYSYNIPEWQGEIMLLPNKSEYYQVAFESVFSGSGTAEIQLDNIIIMEFANIMDVEVAEIITPFSGENLTNSEPVKILLKNNGSELLTGFTLQLELDGTIITTETYTDSISSLEQVEYTFATALDLSVETTFQIKVTAIAENDYIFSNNSITFNVENIICPKITSFPWIEDFENNGTEFPKCWDMTIPYSEYWKWNIVPASEGTPSTAFSGNYKAYIYHAFSGLPEYTSKLITPTFDLSAINTPVLTFGYNIHRQNSNISVYYKNSPIGEWTLLKTFSDNNTDWQTAAILLPNKSDYYKIAFESTFKGGGIYEAQLDKISISEGEDTSVFLYSVNNISLTPNPVQNLLKISRQSTERVSVNIYNSIGVLIYSFETSETDFQVNVSKFNSGIYFICLSNNNMSSTKQFVKQ